MASHDSAPAAAKVCRGCGETKDPAQFRKGRNYCRLCESAKEAERRRANGDAIRARHRGYYHADHDRYVGYAAQDRARRRDERAAAERERYRAHPEKVRAATLRWRKAHPERVRQMQRDWKARLGASYTAHYQAWWASYYPRVRERCLVNSSNRRALKRRAAGRYSRADLDLIRAAQRGLCAYCASPLSAPVHVDHMTALRRGGANWPDNLALTCARCNLRKGCKSAGEFLAVLVRERRAYAAT